ncbi:unnamed protein product [Dimorphilus gyrociliatus]|uniref:Uncharacterized protein n=1 Tax=Dimorphilus gyrociliatus TaxID=2664684 RepID=A0A7I8VRR1_9ANNE|nr:unnamed protein product [Dimorphilus gyrociliatus]
MPALINIGLKSALERTTSYGDSRVLNYRIRRRSTPVPILPFSKSLILPSIDLRRSNSNSEVITRKKVSFNLEPTIEKVPSRTPRPKTTPPYIQTNRKDNLQQKRVINRTKPSAQSLRRTSTTKEQVHILLKCVLPDINLAEPKPEPVSDEERQANVKEWLGKFV